MQPKTVRDGRKKDEVGAEGMEEAGADTRGIAPSQNSGGCLLVRRIADRDVSRNYSVNF
jgi:hypothetical protein